MAYMNQEKKKRLTPGIKAVLKQYGVKATIAVNYATLIVNIPASRFDFIGNYADKSGDELNGYLPNLSVNPYYITDHYTGECAEFLIALKDAMMDGNHDKSDLMTDYHNVGWYISINIGQWDKPYTLIA